MRYVFAGGRRVEHESVFEDNRTARLFSPLAGTKEERLNMEWPARYVFAGGVHRTAKEEAAFAQQHAARLYSPMAHKQEETDMTNYAFAGDAPYGEAPALEHGAARLLSKAQHNIDKDVAPFSGSACAVYIDSGAYSAWSRGAVIDLNEYMTFLKRWSAVVTHAFNLDCIPGKKGVPPTADEVQQSIQTGFDNWRTMRANGLHTIHTYHAFEPVHVLHALRDEALSHMPDPYIAIGGAAKLLVDEMRHRWLRDVVWPALVDADGKPRLKVHGLGMTDQKSITSFPWQSVDSTSWLFNCSQGKIGLWRDGTLRWYYASERHRQGWHSYAEAEKQAIQEALGQQCRAFASLPPKEQFLLLMRHNVKELKKFETMIPATFAPAKRGQRPLL